MADKMEKAKKRKRDPNGSAKPSKRVSIEKDKQIKITLHETDKWAPIIGMPAKSRNYLTWLEY
jgi:DNA-directed RNA polymerase I subunit RPA49